jgi:acyl carrier protein
MNIKHANGGYPSLRRRVNDVITRAVQHIEEPKITDASEFIADLGCDSLDVIEIQFAAEEAFSIEITDKDADGLRTVRDLHVLIERKLHQVGAQ